MKNLYDDISFKSSKYITKTYSTSFSLGIYLLDKSLHEAIYSIYGFVRLADEIVDTFHEYPKKSMLEDFKSPLSYMMAIDFQTYMLDDILQKVDRATMTNSLEGREPMLDHRILEFVAQLPDEYKYQNGVKKRILREIAHDHIPKELLDRPKMGFAIPIAKWLKNELRDHVEEYLNEDRIEKQGIFNWAFIAKLKLDFYSGRKEYDSKLWYFLMFQMWHERWMEN